ncbi:hypothetical protein BHAOGJBA_1354 [Methylobacterium hispanicum]|uniref:Uncharacterized protein n=1 Tax=Methylobacterium hispanicum TaxID=270350 RepID=A0AAV4ZIC0_9HYPH|nr:hypothetical protein [Methylobacterium hispanicum]GJD87849.1 hypothetical protein BHAOGJBA_1354 [Methylobacterium hispanicum]
MELLSERVKALGGDPAEFAIVGRVEMALAGTKNHYGGSKVDSHKPRIVRLALAVNGDVVAELAAGSREFAETAKALKAVRRVPLFEMLTEVGVPLRREGEDFRLAWQELVDLLRAKELLFVSLLEDGGEKVGEAAWIRFRYDRAFKETPCTQVEFEAIRQEFQASRYVTGMDLSDYYSWWRRSQKMMDGDAIAATGLAEAGRLLDAWSSDQDPRSLKYWLCRNLEVHPRHKAAFEQLVDARIRVSAGDVPNSPSP